MEIIQEECPALDAATGTVCGVGGYAWVERDCPATVGGLVRGWDGLHLFHTEHAAQASYAEHADSEHGA